MCTKLMNFIDLSAKWQGPRDSSVAHVESKKKILRFHPSAWKNTNFSSSPKQTDWLTDWYRKRPLQTSEHLKMQGFFLWNIEKNVTITGAYSVQYSGIPEYFMEEILNITRINLEANSYGSTKCTYHRTVGNRLLVMSKSGTTSVVCFRRIIV